MDTEETIPENDIMITIEKLEELKQKYSQELKDSPDNPIKICMKLIFEGATEKDATKRSPIAYQLSEFLTKPDGIINLFLSLIDFDSTSQRVTTLNQRFIAVANIITCLPRLCMSYEEYSKNIYKQLKPLLVNPYPKYSDLASIIIRALIDSPHATKYGERIKDIIIKPITEAITQPSEEYRLNQAIIAVHKLISNHLPIELFIDIFPHLIIAFDKLSRSMSDLKKALESSLISILTGLKPEAACCLLEKTLFSNNIMANMYVVSLLDDEVPLRFNNVTPDNLESKDGSSISKDTILSLIEASDNELLVLEFFFHFQNAIWTAKKQDHLEMIVSLIMPLLRESSDERSESKLDIGPIIATNRQKSLELIAHTLLNYKSYLMTCSGAKGERSTKLGHINQSMGISINILEVLYANLCDRDDEIVLMTKCYPVLKELGELLNTIQESKDAEPLNSIELLLKKLDNQKSHDNDCKINTSQEKEFATILKDLNDKLVPVRVHAIVTLRQMVLSNDPFILPRIPQLYSMIECSLADNEPYVFLACINLLTEMAIRNTPDILPKLIELYTRQDIEVQNRTNVGEVLIRIVKQLNETTPYWAQQVLNALIIQCEDSEESIRKSSLINIGEICKNLGSSLGKYIVEILVVVRSILDTDTVEVKCAAVDLLRTTLSGADCLLTIETIQRELKEVYITLKRIRGVTIDNKLCLQINLALEEIDRIARAILTGSSDTISNGEQLRVNSGGADKITKNIKVLSLL